MAGFPRRSAEDRAVMVMMVVMVVVTAAVVAVMMVVMMIVLDLLDRALRGGFELAFRRRLVDGAEGLERVRNGA